jgi:hypothetical protein
VDVYFIPTNQYNVQWLFLSITLFTVKWVVAQA